MKKYSRKTERLFLLFALITTAFMAVFLYFPVIHVTTDEPEKALHTDDIVLMLPQSEFKRQDLVAYHYDNKVLFGRVIGLPGDHVVITENGEVAVNGDILEEPYAFEENRLDDTLIADMEEGEYFILQDRRSGGADSRNREIGSVKTEQIIGKTILRVWPLETLNWKF